MAVLYWVFGCCCACSVAYYALASFAGLRFARRAAKCPPLPEELPAVALLKPLHGCDEELAANLRSFMELDYPRKEYIFGITTADDPAAAALHEMKRSYPDAQIAETVGDVASANRKVGKLLKILQRAPESEILVMSDADVRVDRDYLNRIVAELEADRSVGLATCLYKGIAPAGSLGARLEASYINTDFAPTAFVSHLLEPMRHAFASTVAIRQSVLKEVGGLEAVQNCFGDDFALARRVAAQGYRIFLSSSLVTMVVERTSLREFWQRQMRWAIVDRRIRPVSLARMLINGPFWALALCLASGLGWPWGLAAIVTAAARLAMAAVSMRFALRLPVRFADLLLTLPKDLVMQVIWFASLMGGTVAWRGRKLRLLPSGEMEEVATRR